MSIFDKISDSLNKELPFVGYRKPNSSIITGFFQKSNSLFFTKDFTESGFVFAPFENTSKAILIPESKSNFFQDTSTIDNSFEYKNDFPSNKSSKEKHIDLVKKAIGSIRKSKFEKVVVSRKEFVKVSNFNVAEVYQKLLQKYQNAFVYVWYHPKVGFWLGATPETLLNISGNTFETMSLAGTQVSNELENVIWKNKEIEEQLLVTNFIKKQLKSITSELVINDRETVKAGNLLHLKTKVSGKLKTQNFSLKTLIEALHPTPAVCGLPREASKEFILNEENYERTFYTGFLGELNLNGRKFKVESPKLEVGIKKSSLFVNLRCMEIKEDKAHVFVGGGITKDSNAEKEWEETVSKTKTMKSVL